MKTNLKEKIEKIKVVCLDVDGVLTNGKIILDDTGREIKSFDVRDGLGIHLLRKAGIKTAIISARSSAAIDLRARDLRIDRVYQNAYPKDEAFEDMSRFFQVEDYEVCFIGDDLPDICIFKRVGLAIAPRNASFEAKQAADYITTRCGGEGAVREAVELILKNKGQWESILNNF